MPRRSLPPPKHIKDGAFEAEVCLALASRHTEGKDRGVEYDIAVSLRGLTGSTGILNPFAEENSPETCHLLIYDCKSRVVDIYPHHSPAAHMDRDAKENGINLAASRSVGRIVGVTVSSKMLTDADLPLFAQVVFFDDALGRPRPHFDLTGVTTIDKYRTATRGRIVAASEPMRLDSEPIDATMADLLMQESSVTVRLASDRSVYIPRQNASCKVTIANLLPNDVYVSPDARSSVPASARRPMLILESPAGERLGSIAGALPAPLLRLDTSAAFPHGASYSAKYRS